MAAHITIENKDYALTPSVDALQEVEKKLNMSIPAISQRLAEGELMLHELLVIIKLCLEQPVAESAISSALLQGGYSQVMQAAAKMFAGLFEAVESEAEHKAMQELMAEYPDD